MIPPAFAYHAPRTLPDAIRLLSELGDDAKLLAGGHSLLPMMKLRSPALPRSSTSTASRNFAGYGKKPALSALGAMTTENELIASELLKEKVPLLPEAAQLIADPQVRNRGTIGGDIAHGDPGNDHPAISMALEAVFVLQGPQGERKVKATEFFQDTYMTALAENEILTAILVPPMAAGTGYAYTKLKRKTGDWATAGAAVILNMSAGKVTQAPIALTNVAPTALRASAAAAGLIGRPIDAASLNDVATAVRAICDPAEDLRGDAEYKTAMAAEMVKRAIQKAAARCH
uniref:Cut B protein n=1 Tax=Pseudomonas thermocarboxydovorans TaxID=34066 RepID=Q52588_9PSED|nr:cut B [Pseudomonas thermocarboxydovorans]prf//2107180A Mo-containing hydroxylase CO dehydrogenase [Pseudomonas thermocarboxydovorans]